VDFLIFKSEVMLEGKRGFIDSYYRNGWWKHVEGMILISPHEGNGMLEGK
jgi:hypothetical protein